MTEWERCRPWIVAALEYAGGTHTIEDIEAAIDAQKMALIPLERCAFVVEVIDYPRARAFHIFLAGGDLNEMRAFDPQLQDYARRLGCDRITIAGREGFVRALRDLGYRPKWAVLSKDV